MSDLNRECKLIADYGFELNKMSISWDELLNETGTSIWKKDGYIEMKVPIQNDRVVRQTKQYFKNNTGKYIKCLFTVVLNTIDDNGYTSRIGSFDDHNDKTILPGDIGGSGFFFEYTDNILYIGIRYGTDDNGTDIILNQTNFNINNLMRLSHRSITEWTKIHTYEILYNNIGTIEWSVYLDGEKILLHKEQDITKTLHTLPRYNLPLRVEIIKNNNDNGMTIGEMRQFNTSIMFENGFIDPPTIIPNDLPPCETKHLSNISCKTFNITTNFFKPIFSIKLKDIYIRNIIKNYELLYLVKKKSAFMYIIVKNPTFTGNSPVWTDTGTEYKLEYDITADTVDLNNLDIIFEQYVDSNCCSGTMTQDTNLKYSCISPIISDIQGNADIITILVRKMSPSNVVLNFNFRWIEE